MTINNTDDETRYTSPFLIIAPTNVGSMAKPKKSPPKKYNQHKRSQNRIVFFSPGSFTQVPRLFFYSAYKCFKLCVRHPR